jgi:hypothetical protein
MPKYRNYAGQTITCPKSEGTCWQPEHLTKEQVRIKRNTSASLIGDTYDVNDGTSYANYDAYEAAARKYEYSNPEVELPTHAAGKAIHELAKTALNVESLLVKTSPEEENGLYGYVTFGTAKNDKGFIDGVTYAYEIKDGETTFFKNKSFGRKEEVTAKTIQKDVYKERKAFQKMWDSLGSARA